MSTVKILIDARELSNRQTGISRFIEGLVNALLETSLNWKQVLAVQDIKSVPESLHNKKLVQILQLPNSFIKSEVAFARVSKQGFRLMVSPYPKLPLYGGHCYTVHTIHDVLDLTHPAYKKRLKASIDKLRLRLALRKADLSWYDSAWSMKETFDLVGSMGKKPRVRYLGISDKFGVKREEDKDDVLENYGLKRGYILVIGNGLLHKNLGVVLKISNKLKRKLVFVGVSIANQDYWIKHYHKSEAIWIKYVEDEDLPAIIRGAFCLAQPSTAEGYGYPPLEAMACGVPAVVSNIPVLVETTGGHAFTADPNNPKEWMEAFNALEDNAAYHCQATKGLKWVKPFRGRKAWNFHIADIEELLTEK